MNDAITSQADTLGSILITRLLEASLKPYGIDEPGSFLRAIGPEIVTARLDDSGSSTVTIVEVRDEQTLHYFVSHHLGAKSRLEMVGDVEMLVSSSEKHEAASFVGGHLILGTAENLRRCLEARNTGRKLEVDDEFQRSRRLISETSTANVATFTEDYSPARNFIKAIATQPGVRERPVNEQELEDALRRLRYAVSETAIVDGGIEKRTRSSFGQLGTFASQFFPSDDSTTALR